MKSAQAIEFGMRISSNISLIELDVRSEYDYGGACAVQVSNKQLRVIFSCSHGWDHVSVSTEDRTPTYQEMKAIKDLFFKSEEWAMELHPPKEQYISAHPYVLHIWRPHHIEIPQPPRIMI